jgi:hypothetical protein
LPDIDPEAPINPRDALAMVIADLAATNPFTQRADSLEERLFAISRQVRAVIDALPETQPAQKSPPSLACELSSIVEGLDAVECEGMYSEAFASFDAEMTRLRGFLDRLRSSYATSPTWTRIGLIHPDGTLLWRGSPPSGTWRAEGPFEAMDWPSLGAFGDWIARQPDVCRDRLGREGWTLVELVTVASKPYPKDMIARPSDAVAAGGKPS